MDEKELRRRACEFAARWGAHSAGVGEMMAAFAAEMLREREVRDGAEFELPKDAEFSCDVDEGAFHVRWVAPDKRRAVYCHVKESGRINVGEVHVGEAGKGENHSRALVSTSVQNMVSGRPTAPVDLRRAAEEQLGILDHWGAQGEDARVATAIFRNAAFTVRKLVEALGGPAAQAR